MTWGYKENICIGFPIWHVLIYIWMPHPMHAPILELPDKWYLVYCLSLSLALERWQHFDVLNKTCLSSSQYSMMSKFQNLEFPNSKFSFFYRMQYIDMYWCTWTCTQLLAATLTSLLMHEALLATALIIILVAYPIIWQFSCIFSALRSYIFSVEALAFS